jgi:hypothetical protein
MGVTEPDALGGDEVFARQQAKAFLAATARHGSFSLASREPKLKGHHDAGCVCGDP